MILQRAKLGISSQALLLKEQHEAMASPQSWLEMQNLSPILELLDQSLHFNKILKWSAGILMFEKLCCKEHIAFHKYSKYSK